MYYVANQKARAQRDATEVLKYKPSNLLNIGGVPFLLEACVRDVASDLPITTLDHDPSRFSDVADHLKITSYAMDIETEDFHNYCKDNQNKYDVVMLCEVLEHLRTNPLETLSNISNLIHADGILYLTTPNGLSVRGIRRLLKGRTGPSPVREYSKIAAIGHMGHVREYSSKEVREMLTHSGFEIVQMKKNPHWNSFNHKPGPLNKLMFLIDRVIPSVRWNIVVIAKPSNNRKTAN